MRMINLVLVNKYCLYFLGVKELFYAALVKRETGVSPVRTRRCENGVFTKCHWGNLGRL